MNAFISLFSNQMNNSIHSTNSLTSNIKRKIIYQINAVPMSYSSYHLLKL